MTDTLKAAENYIELKGLHLFHSGASSCSQRVRLMLIEKGLSFESHILSIGNAEHASDAYQKMNPEGLVPTLVHDGLVVADSFDILRYIEETFPDQPLLPKAGPERDHAINLVTLTDGCQDAIKTLSNELMFGAKARKSTEELARFAVQHKNEQLVRFHTDFSQSGDAWKQRVQQSYSTLDAALATIEATLLKTEFLTGLDWGLADIAWAPNAHRMMHLRIPYGKYPHYVDWYSNTRLKGSFREAILAWEPELNDLSPYEG